MGFLCVLVKVDHLVNYLVLRMASLVESFTQDPSESLLEQCTKEQLLRIAEHYGIDIPDKK